ncbi:MAG: hypothetical protein MAG458_01568 [Nitrosopumilus sp.]|nr:hypothetical protein [Nitrosopumilus sp.]
MQGIKAEETREKYTRTLKRILCVILEDFLEGSFDQRANQLVKMAKDDPKWIIDILLNLSKKLRERTTLPKDHADYLNPSSVTNYFKPIRKLLDMNDVAIPWKRIQTTFPEIDNITQSREWRRVEIQNMLNYANGAIDRAIVLIAASSGIRAGAFNLNWEDVIPIYNVNDQLKTEISESETKDSIIACAMIMIYKGTSAQYPAFITAEAYEALQNHKKEWKNRIGRESNPDEPVFIKEGMLVRKASTVSIKRRIERMIERAGLRAPLTEGKKRHEVPIMNGFRRFFNKTIKQEISSDSALASLIKKEYMMGHTGLVKLDKNYFKTNVIELAKEYLEASKSLTISDEHILKVENKSLKLQKNDLENTNLIRSLQKRIEDLEYGKDAREGEYAKNALQAKTPLEKAISNILVPIFEWGNDEKYKRKFWKENLAAKKEDRPMNRSAYARDYVKRSDEEKREIYESATKRLEYLEKHPYKDEAPKRSGKLGSKKTRYHEERILRELILECKPT